MENPDPTLVPTGELGYPAVARLSRGLLIGGRYRLAAPLKTGGFSRVFVADDERLGRRVAVKFLDPSRTATRADAERAQARFARESRVIASLEHPHIVTLFDSGVEGELPYLVLQLLDGETLGERIRAGRLPPVAEGLRSLREVAGALGFAHGRGILHRDVKPDNVVLDERGSARVLDFGLARVLGESSDTLTGNLVGTPPYLAPELLHGEEPTAASDVFSAGVTFYEYLTGRYPFSRQAVLYSIACEEAPAPTRVRADLPRPLEAVLLRMLAKRREDRYPDFVALERDLRRLGGAEGGDLALDEDFFAWQSSAGRRALALPFVGRAAEIARVETALGQAGAGEGNARAWLGEAGLGKSRLIEEGRELARLRQVGTWTGRALDTGGDFPYQVFVSLLRNWADQHDLRNRQALDQHVAGKAPELLGISHLLASLLAFSPGEAREREQVWEAFVRLIESMARERPALVVLEDLHWADPPSLALLRYVLERLRGKRVALLLTARPDSAAARLIAGELQAGNLLEVGRLGPLGSEAVHEIAARLLPEESAARRLGDLLYRETEGLPLFLAELLKLLKGQGALVERGAGYELVRDPSVSDLPDGMRSLLGRRVEGLSREERGVADLAAVWGEGFEVEDLLAIAGGDRMAMLRALSELERRHHVLVAQGLKGYRFAHDRLRALLYDDLPPAIRAGYHGLVAEAIERKGRPDDAPRLARHQAAAGRPAEAARWHRLAAEQARRTAAFEEAAHHLERALALDPGCEPIATRLELGEDLIKAIRFDAARRWLGEALERSEAAGDAVQACRALLGLAKVAERDGQAELALGHVDRALATLPPDGGTTLEAWLHHERGEILALLGDRPGARAANRSALRVARGCGTDRELGWSLYRVSRDCLQDGQLADAAALLEEAAAPASRCGDPILGLRVRQGRARLERDAGHLERAVELFREALAIASQTVGPAVEAEVRMGLCQALSLAGDYPDLLRELASVLAFSRQAGFERLLIVALTNRMEAAEEQGRIADAQETLSELLALSARADAMQRAMIGVEQAILHAKQGDLAQARAILRPIVAARGPLTRAACFALGRAEATLGDRDEGLALLARVVGEATSTAELSLRGRAQAALAQARLAAEDPAGAAAVLAGVSPLALESRTTARELALARGLVAEARGDRAGARGELELAIGIAVGQEARLPEAEARLALVRVLRALGAPELASAERELERVAREALEGLYRPDTPAEGRAGNPLVGELRRLVGERSPA